MFCYQVVFRKGNQKKCGHNSLSISPLSAAALGGHISVHAREGEGWRNTGVFSVSRSASHTVTQVHLPT